MSVSPKGELNKTPVILGTKATSGTGVLLLESMMRYDVTPQWLSDLHRQLATKVIEEYRLEKILQILSECPDYTKVDKALDIPEKKAKKKKMKMNTPNSLCAVTEINWAGTNSLASLCLSPPAQTVPCVNETKGKKKMFNDFDDYDCCAPRTPEQEKATYLDHELRQAYRKIDRDLRKWFKMDEPLGPDTLIDMLDAMKNGKYTIDPSYLNDDGTIRKDAAFYVWNFGNYFSWRTADNQADAKGYAEAEKKLNAANKDAQRMIAIGTPAEGLAALKAFEQATYA